MSKRSRTTLTIQIKLSLPPGATQKDALAFVYSAIEHAKDEKVEHFKEEPLASLQINEVIIKIVARDTVYL